MVAGVAGVGAAGAFASVSPTLNPVFGGDVRPRAVNVLLVPFVTGELGASEAWFGPLEAAQVAAMVAAATLVAAFSSRLRPKHLISVGAVGLGASVGSLAGCTAPWQLLLAVFAAGWFLAPLQAAVTTLLQTTVVPSYRARAQAAFTTLVSRASLAAMSLVGVAAEVAGARGVFLAAGAIIVAAGVVSAVTFRGVARLPAPALEARS